jgi:hypothetical protein
MRWDWNRARFEEWKELAWRLWATDKLKFFAKMLLLSLLSLQNFNNFKLTDTSATFTLTSLQISPSLSSIFLPISSQHPANPSPFSIKFHFASFLIFSPNSSKKATTILRASVSSSLLFLFCGQIGNSRRSERPLESSRLLRFHDSFCYWCSRFIFIR